MTGGKVWAGDYGDGSVEGSAANLVDVLGIEVERGLERMGMLPMGIGETLIQSLSKLVLRAVGYQANTDYGNLQLCTGLEDFIEEVTHAMG